MKRSFTGKCYFAWLGWMDAQIGRPILNGRSGKLRWPLWARAAYARGWLSFPRRGAQ
jgi:hypothetical protein